MIRYLAMGRFEGQVVAIDCELGLFERCLDSFQSSRRPGAGVWPRWRRLITWGSSKS